MKIQIVSNKVIKYKCKYDITYSSLNKPQSLDSFDINIFSLQDESIWRYDDDNNKILELTNDFKSINQMICNSKKAINIVLFPQNYKHLYGWRDYDCRYF